MKKYEISTSDENLKLTINNNILERNEKIINLMKLLNNVNENFIISIDGEWGTGKTFFVKQLIYISNHYSGLDILKNCENHNEIKVFSEKHIIVYYNAWENDNHENPLESLMYKILNEYPKYKSCIANISFENIKPLLKNIIEKGSLGFINKESLEKIESFQDLAKNIITVEEKQEALKSLLDKIIGDDKRIMLIIDELDRCKPDFAVKLLETLKHFYNNPKMTCIVATNNRQLSYTIKKYYGTEFDGYGYLNKIYDTVITLGTDKLEEYTKNYCGIMQYNNLPEKMSFVLFKFLNFSYRECNKYMSIYNIIEPYTDYRGLLDRNSFLFESDVILPMTIALKIKNIEYYNEFITGNGDNIITSFINYLENTAEGNDYIQWVYDILKLKENDNLIEGFIRKYKDTIINKTNHQHFPYFEAISMLGNSINFNDIEEKF